MSCRKIESAADLHAVDWVMANLEREQSIAGGSIDLMPIIETAAGVQRVDRILQARSLRPYKGAWRVKRIAFGAGDYANDVGLSPTLEEAELEDARARLVLSSRAAGMENPIDSPWFHFKEADAFRRALERSRRCGFQGRLCVHPTRSRRSTRRICRAVEELARAERIVAAFEAAEAKGEAAIQVDGQMIDYPIVHRARAVLEDDAQGEGEVTGDVILAPGLWMPASTLWLLAARLQRAPATRRTFSPTAAARPSTPTSSAWRASPARRSARARRISSATASAACWCSRP